MKDEQITIDYISGNCPVQAEGHIGAEPFYFRARHEHWSMSIGGADVIGNPQWYHEEPYGDSEFAAGWMPQCEALSMMAKAFCAYANRTEPAGVEKVKRDDAKGIFPTPVNRKGTK